MQAGLIDELDDEITRWAGATAEGFAVSLDPPTPEAGESSLSLYLLELAPEPPGRGPRRAPLQFRARYLVTASATDPREAHAALGALLFSALENHEWEVDQRPVSLEVWGGLGVAPRPSFVVSGTVRKELPESPGKQVREAVFLPTTVSSFHGIVLTPDDVPIPLARVELPQLDVMTTTDARGRFAIQNVPSEPAARVVTVAAKGRHRHYEVAALALIEDPLVLRFEMEEE
ncbi:MAG: hypothetical protein GEU71_05190 [Actinobacteria bacterium]|nr:hypothetical protein [Actinomycetota bacterium]